MFMVWYTFFRPAGRDLWWFLTEKTVYLGLITLFCYEALYATSLASFRKWWYELFLGLHVGLQAGALGFLYFHHRGSKPYVRVTLAIFLLDRIVFRLLAKSREFKANVKVMPDGNTVLLSGNWPISAKRQSMWRSLFSKNMHSGWDPAEHVFVTIPSLGRKHMFQAHPFTIASAAPSYEQEHAWFDLIIRALDGFTRDLLIHAESCSSVIIRLDGPYGSSHAYDMLPTPCCGLCYNQTPAKLPSTSTPKPRQILPGVRGEWPLSGSCIKQTTSNGSVKRGWTSLQLLDCMLCYRLPPAKLGGQMLQL
jgi:hypothetical protein